MKIIKPSIKSKFYPILIPLIIIGIFFLGCMERIYNKQEIVTSIPVETELRSDITPNTATVWKNMVDSAEKSIDMAFFYIVSKKNELLEHTINSLINASNRGVKIRILTDIKMKKNSLPLIRRLEKYKNFKIVIFDWSKLTKGILHAKYFIIDDSEAFLGSQNFDWRSLKHIHETGVVIKDHKIVHELKSIFEVDWEYNSGKKSAYDFKKVRKTGKNFYKKKIFIAASPEKYNPPGIPGSLKIILTFINSAKKSIRVQLLDYKTSIWGKQEQFLELDNALKKAALRGVNVKIIVSDWNLRKPGVESLKKLSGFNGIKIRFIKIPQSHNGFIPYSRVVHSKVMRIDDDILMIGTSNWSSDYFYRSRNIELFIKNRKMAKKLDTLFNDLWSSKYSKSITREGHYIPPRIYLP